MIEGAGVELAVTERGAGAPVVLIHGIGEDATTWDATARELEDHARVIAYDRRGYGASGAPEPYERTTVEEQAEDAAALIDALGAAPVLAVGRDLGSLVCLDLARRHPSLVSAVVLAEPWLFALVPNATEVLSEERLALEGDLREHGPQEAVRRQVARTGGDETAANRATASHLGFFADYGASAAWNVTRRELRGLELPVVVTVRAAARRHVRAAAEAVAALIPHARLDEDAELAAVIRGLLDRESHA